MDTRNDRSTDGESLTRLLRAHGITPTSQRLQVARELFVASAHYSAEEVYERVNGSEAAVSKATIYNTLGLFVAKGLLRQVFVEPGKVIYDTNVQAHDHFYDVESGTLTDIDSVGVALNALPSLPPGTELERVDVIVRVRRRS